MIVITFSILIGLPWILQARPIRCSVEAGEMLFIPSLFYHQVRGNATARFARLIQGLQVSQGSDRGGRTIAVNYWYDMAFDIKWVYGNFMKAMTRVQ